MPGVWLGAAAVAEVRCFGPSWWKYFSPLKPEGSKVAANGRFCPYRSGLRSLACGMANTASNVPRKINTAAMLNPM